MNLLPIKDLVVAKTDLVFGEDLFVYSMPGTVKRGLLLLIDPGFSEIDHEIPCRFRARFQAIIRHDDYEQGYALAMIVYNAISSEITEDLGDYKTNYRRPRNLPLPFKRSDGDLIEFSINFETLFYTTG